MFFAKSAKRSTKSRALKILGLSSTVWLGSAAIAGGVSLVYTALQMPDSMVASWLTRPLAGSTTVATSSLTTTSTTTSTPTPTATPTPSIPATKLGMNVAPAHYFVPTRVFTNLLAGDVWNLFTNGAYTTNIPASYLDANNNIIKLSSTEGASRSIAPPTAVLQGGTADVICRWTGTGQLIVKVRESAKNVMYGTRWVRFTYLPTTNAWPILDMLNESSSDPVKNVDCREYERSQTEFWDPTFMANVKKYNTIRFLNWSNINDNHTARWATRNKAGSTNIWSADGYPLEYMIKLANDAHVNPWFTLPWNADDDYIRQYATMVRDTLDPTLKAYVENSNEVWNWGFGQSQQARDEGLAEGLVTDGNQMTALLRRYAEKSAHVMDIWTDVFSGQTSRIVRVAANMNALPDNFKTIMQFRDTPNHFDALASAPYFEADLNTVTSTTDLSSFFTAWQQTLDLRISNALAVKAIAKQYGKRYVTYEAGQHALGNDTTLLYSVQHDARIGTLYTRYLTRWQKEIGDLMVLYQDFDATSRYGAFGHQDYPGQPLTKSPKAQAVTRFLASINNTAL